LRRGGLSRYSQLMSKLWAIAGAALGLAGCDLGPKPHSPLRADCDLVAGIAVSAGNVVDIPEKPGQAAGIPSSLDILIGNYLAVTYPDDQFAQHYARCRKIEAGGGF